MNFQEKLTKYNYIKFIHTPKDVHSTYVEGKPYKIESYVIASHGNHAFMVADEIGHKYRIYCEGEKRRFIFVTDKYALKYGAKK